MEKGDVKPDTDVRLVIKVVSQNGSEMCFQIKNSTRMSKMIETYCSRMGCSPDSVRFLYDGVRVQPESTPMALGLKNNDVIDAMLTQVGG